MKTILSLVGALLVIGAAVFLVSNRTGGSPLSPSSQALVLCEEGTADMNAFRLNEARDKLQASLELDPNLAEASISLAFTFARLGRSDEFRVALARADSLVGNIPDADRRMMLQLQLSGARPSRFFASRDSLLDRLGVEKPDNIHVLVAQAENSRSEEEREKAWQKVIEVNPNFANGYNMLGYLELSRGNYEKAAEHMQKYAFLAPDLANPHDSLGDVYFAQGRYEEAEAEYVASVTMQPDFYASLINLGRTFLARGQIAQGLDILEKVRQEIAGSTLEQRVDLEIVQTLIFYDLNDKIADLTSRYVVKWPEDGNAAFFRAMRLAHLGKLAESQAVMDSSLTMWRLGEGYLESGDYREHIDRAGKRYQGLIADLADSPATRVRQWAGVVALSAKAPLHEQWYERWRLGEALLDNGQPALALEQITPLLEINPRLINPLLLAVKSYLALGDAEVSRQALEQAKWALGKADPDFPPVLKLRELEARVAELEKRGA